MSDAGAPSAAALAEAQRRFPPTRLRRMLLAPRPAFYGLQPVKDDLIALLGLDRAANWLMHSAGWTGPWRATWMPLRSLWDHARERGHAIELLSAGRVVDVAPVRALGGPDLPAGRFRSRDILRTVIADATVYSKSNFVRVDDSALLDVQGDELARFALNLNTDAAVMAASADRVALLERDDEPYPVVDEALSLLGVHSFAFGHWISELLPKLWNCLGVAGFERVTILVDQQMPAQHLEALRAFAGQDHPVRILVPGERLQVRQLWVVATALYYPIGARPDSPTPAGWGAVDTQVYTSLLQRIEPRWLPQVRPASVPRLYLARADTQHRRLLNRGPVEDWHRARGFEIHDFNHLGFVQQLALVRGAQTVTGPEGSSFFCTFFAPAQACVGILTGPTLDISESYAQITQARGQRLRILKGVSKEKDAPGQYFADYSIDATRLPEFMDQLHETGCSGD